MNSIEFISQLRANTTTDAAQALYREPPEVSSVRAAAADTFGTDSMDPANAEEMRRHIKEEQVRGTLDSAQATARYLSDNPDRAPIFQQDVESGRSASLDRAFDSHALNAQQQNSLPNPIEAFNAAQKSIADLAATRQPSAPEVSPEAEKVASDVKKDVPVDATPAQQAGAEATADAIKTAAKDNVPEDDEDYDITEEDRELRTLKNAGMEQRTISELEKKAGTTDFYNDVAAVKFAAVGRGWDVGVKENKISDIYTAALNDQRELTTEERAQVEQLTKEIARSDDIDRSSLFYSSGKMVGQMLDSYSASDASLAAIGLGFVVLGVAAVAAPVVGVAGVAAGVLGTVSAGLGASVGAIAAGTQALATYRVESAGVYQSLLDEGVEPTKANYFAQIAGALNAFVDIIGIQAVGKLLGISVTKSVNAFVSKEARTAFNASLTRKFLTEGAEGMAKGLDKLTLGAAALRAGRGIVVGTTVVEPGSEIMQEINSMIAEQVAGRVFGDIDKVPEITMDYVVDRMWEVYTETVKGTALLALTGGVGRFGVDIRNVYKAQSNKVLFDAIDQYMAESDAAKRSPSTVDDYLTKQAKDSGSDTVYVEQKAFRQTMIDQGVTMEELRKVAPEIADQLEKLEKSPNGGDVQIPIGVYGTRFANTKFGLALRNAMRLDKTGVSIAELPGVLAEARKLASGLTNPEELANKKISDKFKPIYESYVGQITKSSQESGLNWSKAQIEGQARIATIMCQSLASAANISPEQAMALMPKVVTQVGKPGLDAERQQRILNAVNQAFVAPEEGADMTPLQEAVQNGAISGTERDKIQAIGELLTRAAQQTTPAARAELEKQAGDIFDSLDVGTRLMLEQSLPEDMRFERTASGRWVPSDKALPNYQKALRQRQEADRARGAAKAAEDAKLDAEYMAAVESGDMEKVQQMVEERASAMGFGNAIPEQAGSYSVRTKAAPKKTVKCYKVFTMGDGGQLSALFVGGADRLPMGIWLDCQDVFHFTAKNGKQYVPCFTNPDTKKKGGGTDINLPADMDVRRELLARGYISDINSKTCKCVAYRPGWHAGELPLFPQSGKKVPASQRSKHAYTHYHSPQQVVCEIEVDADTDWTDFARNQKKAKNKKGEVVPKWADLQQIPEDGFYWYTTNPLNEGKEDDTGRWLISSSIKINRVLSEEEVNKILDEHGKPHQAWSNTVKVTDKSGKTKEITREAPLDLEALGYSGDTNDAARKTLAPITRDENGDIIPLSKRFNPDNPSVLYQSVIPADKLVTVHKLSEKSLLHAFKLGGMPMPSLGITKADTPYIGFGDIALIGTSGMIDPDNGTAVYDRDAYTKSFPRNIIETWDIDGFHALMNHFVDLASEFGEDKEVIRIQDHVAQKDTGYSESDFGITGKALFLRETGVDIPSVTVDGRKHFDAEGINREVAARAEAFKLWMDEKNKIFERRQMIKKGNGKNVPATLDNILQEMLESVKARGEIFTDYSENDAAEHASHSGGGIRAASAQKMKSLEEIKSRRDEVIDSDRMLEENRALVSLYQQVGESLYDLEFDGEGTEETALFGIVKAMANDPYASPEDLLEQFGFKPEDEEEGFSYDLLADIEELGRTVRNNLTDYFEAKPARVVKISEFAAAVVPEGTAESTIKALSDAGLTVRIYDRAGETISQAITSVSNEMQQIRGDILFQRKAGSPAAVSARNAFSFSRNFSDLQTEYQRKYQRDSDQKWSGYTPEVKNGKIAGAPIAINGRKPGENIPMDPDEKPELTDEEIRKNLAAIREQLHTYAWEGRAGRMWYELSAGMVRVLSRGNFRVAQRLCQMFAIYSAHTVLSVNTANALKAMYYWFMHPEEKDAAGLHVATGVQDKKAANVLWRDTDWEGRKTNTFYVNLMYQLITESAETEAEARAQLGNARVDDVIGAKSTIDMWMRRALGYDNISTVGDKGSGGYSFAENEMRVLAARMNAEAAERVKAARAAGVEPDPHDMILWTPHQIQAAVWVAVMSRYQDPRTVSKVQAWISTLKGDDAYTRDVNGDIVTKDILDIDNSYVLWERLETDPKTGEEKWVRVAEDRWVMKESEDEDSGESVFKPELGSDFKKGKKFTKLENKTSKKSDAKDRWHSVRTTVTTFRETGTRARYRSTRVEDVTQQPQKITGTSREGEIYARNIIDDIPTSEVEQNVQNSQRDFSTELEENSLLTTAEFIPSPSLNLPIYLDANKAVQAMFTHWVMQKIFSDVKGGNLLQRMLGIELATTFESAGGYQGSATPNVVMVNAIPKFKPKLVEDVEATNRLWEETVAEHKRTGQPLPKTKTRVMRDTGGETFRRNTIRVICRAIQFITKQDAVPWIIIRTSPLPMSQLKDNYATDAIVSSAGSFSEMMRRLDGMTWEYSYIRDTGTPASGASVLAAMAGTKGEVGKAKKKVLAEEAAAAETARKKAEKAEQAKIDAMELAEREAYLKQKEKDAADKAAAEEAAKAAEEARIAKLTSTMSETELKRFKNRRKAEAAAAKREKEEAEILNGFIRYWNTHIGKIKKDTTVEQAFALVEKRLPWFKELPVESREMADAAAAAEAIAGMAVLKEKFGIDAASFKSFAEVRETLNKMNDTGLHLASPFDKGARDFLDEAIDIAKDILSDKEMSPQELADAVAELDLKLRPYNRGWTEFVNGKSKNHNFMENRAKFRTARKQLLQQVKVPEMPKAKPGETPKQKQKREQDYKEAVAKREAKLVELRERLKVLLTDIKATETKRPTITSGRDFGYQEGHIITFKTRLTPEQETLFQKALEAHVNPAAGFTHVGDGRYVVVNFRGQKSLSDFGSETERIAGTNKDTGSGAFELPFMMSDTEFREKMATFADNIADLVGPDFVKFPMITNKDQQVWVDGEYGHWQNWDKNDGSDLGAALFEALKNDPYAAPLFRPYAEVLAKFGGQTDGQGRVRESASSPSAGMGQEGNGGESQTSPDSAADDREHTLVGAGGRSDIPAVAETSGTDAEGRSSDGGRSDGGSGREAVRDDRRGDTNSGRVERVAGGTERRSPADAGRSANSDAGAGRPDGEGVLGNQQSDALNSEPWIVAAAKQFDGMLSGLTTDVVKAMNENLDLAKRTFRQIPAQLDNGLTTAERDQQTLLLSQARGAYDPSLNTIYLTPNSDLTTFAHEMSHAYLNQIFNLALTAPEGSQVVKDAATLLNAFGLKSVDEWIALGVDGQREHQEWWAYQTEIYLSTGRTTQPAYKRLFANFSAWARRVYSAYKGGAEGYLNVLFKNEFGRDMMQMSPEVREVMDRMFSAGRDITQAEQSYGLMPVFGEKPESMSEAEWREYKDLQVAATMESYQDVVSQSLSEMQWLSNARGAELAKFQKKWDAARKNAHKLMTLSFNARKEMCALNAMKRGISQLGADRGVPEQRKGLKFRLESLYDLGIPGEQIDKLQRLGLVDTSENGWGMGAGEITSLFSSQFGVASPKEFIALICKVPDDIDGEINRMTDEYMKANYSELADPAYKEQMIVFALHNEARKRMLAIEMKYFAGTTRGRLLNNAAKEAARIAASKMTLDELNVNSLARQEQKLSRRVSEELARVDGNDMVKAADLQRKRLLAYYLVKEGQAVAEERKKFERLTKRILSSDKKLAAGRDMNLVNACRSIISAFGWGPTDIDDPLVFIEKVKRYDPDEYDALLSLVTPYLGWHKGEGALTADEFRMMAADIRALWEKAMDLKRLDLAGEDAVVEDVVPRLTAVFSKLPKNTEGVYQAQTDKEKRWQIFRYSGAILRRVESWCERMDNLSGDKERPFARYIFRPISKACTAYRHAYANYMDRYTALLEPMADKWRKAGGITATELGYTFTSKAELVGALLHCGNDSNKRKLLLAGRGVGHEWASLTENEFGEQVLDTSRWDAFIRRCIDEGYLTKEDFDFCQKAWDLLEDTKPLAQKAFKKIYGRYFEEVENSPFTVRFKDGSEVKYKGGYVPAQTEKNLKSEGESKDDFSEMVESQSTYMMPVVQQGFTKTRSPHYAEPLHLDPFGLGYHLGQVLRMAYIHPTAASVLKILRHPEFSAALRSVDREAMDRMLMPWLKRSCSQVITEGVNSPLSRVINNFRTMGTVNQMAFNLANAMQQLTGLGISAAMVKPKHLLRGLVQFVPHPKKCVELVSQHSSFMQTRYNDRSFEFMAEIDKYQSLAAPGKYAEFKAWIKKHAYVFQEIFQSIVDTITWLGAYNEFQESNASMAPADLEREAVQRADSIVRQTQSSFNPEDISAIEVGNAAERFFLVFYNFFNMQYNMLATQAAPAFKAKEYGRFAYMAATIIWIPSVLNQLLFSMIYGDSGDDDDDEDTFTWCFRNLFGSSIQAMVGSVPFAGGVLNYAGGKAAKAGAPGASLIWEPKGYVPDRMLSAPAFSTMENAVKLLDSAKSLANGGGSTMTATKRFADLITVLTGIPTKQVAKPVAYGVGVATGEVEPEDVSDVLHGLATGRKPK